MFRRPTIYLADDNSGFCEAMSAALRREFDVTGFAHEAGGAVAGAIRHKPDIVALDVSMPMLVAAETAEEIRAALPAVRIIFVALNGHEGQGGPLRIGGLGFLVRSTAAGIADALWEVLGAREEVHPAQLTAREKEVVQLLAQGKAMKQVADQLKVSTRTVAFHKYGVMRKLGLHSSAELVRMAVSEGLVA
jgi:DNA-binding NarL/FixJ family response regulator